MLWPGTEADHTNDMLLIPGRGGCLDLPHESTPAVPDTTVSSSLTNRNAFSTNRKQSTHLSTSTNLTASQHSTTVGVDFPIYENNDNETGTAKKRNGIWATNLHLSESVTLTSKYCNFDALFLPVPVNRICYILFWLNSIYLLLLPSLRLLSRERPRQILF